MGEELKLAVKKLGLLHPFLIGWQGSESCKRNGMVAEVGEWISSLDELFKWYDRAAPEPAAPTALQRFTECDGNTESDPIERLRFFCSLAMRGQDWLDVEPFFDAVKAAAPTVVEPELVDRELEYAGWPLIELGYGRVEVAEGTHEEKPALIFGRNGTGRVGEPTPPNRHATHEETLAVVTFSNAESLDVVLGKLNVLRERLTDSATHSPRTPLTDERIEHILARTLDAFVVSERTMTDWRDVRTDIAANSKLRNMFARAVIAASNGGVSDQI